MDFNSNYWCDNFDLFFSGGMKAVIWGDVIQMIILFLGIIICLFYGLNELGGIESFVNNVDKERITAVDLVSGGSITLIKMMSLDFGQWS